MADPTRRQIAMMADEVGAQRCPAPVPVAGEEVAELVAEIRHFLAGYRQIRGLDPEYVYSIHRGDAMEAHIRISRLARAADLLALAYATGPDSWEPIPLLPTQRHPEPVPVPKGPTRDDLWELWLRLNNELPDRPAAVAEFWEHAQIDARARAADLLERQAAPVAVSDRIPGPEDCDAEGRCWAWDWLTEKWWLCDRTIVANGFDHWLPAHALPLPAGEVE